MSEPLKDLSRFIILCVLLAGPVAWAMTVWLKRRWGRGYDGGTDVSSEEILSELKTEFAPSRRTVIRTQTEYLPFLFECIRENIDGGFDDPQVIALLDRIEHQTPEEDRSAVFRVVSDGVRSDLLLLWRRDSWDRIELRIQGAPHIIRALRAYRKTIPRSSMRVC